MEEWQENCVQQQIIDTMYNAPELQKSAILVFAPGNSLLSYQNFVR
jgi:hypothetical protein